MVQLSILTAVVLVLQAAGVVIKIPILGTPVSLVLIPIALGAMILGPAAGAWLGFVFGLEVYIQCGVMGLDPFTAFLFQQNPVITAGICLVKSTLAGYLAGVSYKLMVKKNELLAVFLAAAITPVVNTGVFVAGCFVIFDTITAFAESMSYGKNTIHFIFIGLAGLNFVFEFIINMIFAPSLQRIIHLVGKKVHR
jgi:uncharacterized membrane protein